MIVKLFDRTEIIVTKEAADKLVKSLEKSNDGLISLNGYMIKKSAIAYIRPGGHTEADIVRGQENDPNKRLVADRRSPQEQYESALHASSIARKNLENRGILKRKKVI